MMPTRARTALAWLTTSYPAIRTRPDVGISVVVRIEIVVVLPAPFGPRKAKNSPLRTEKLMSSTALALPFRYRLTRFSTSTMVGWFAASAPLTSPTGRQPESRAGYSTANRSTGERRAGPAGPPPRRAGAPPPSVAGRWQGGTA